MAQILFTMDLVLRSVFSSLHRFSQTGSAVLAVSVGFFYFREVEEYHLPPHGFLR
jgi:hypothetical protein